MTRLFFGVTILCAAFVLAGCPIYSTPSDSRVCGANGCFDCPSGSTPADGTCIPWACSSANDCPTGYVCGTATPGAGLSCVPVAGASDASDCSAGCPSGYLCKLSGGLTQCVPSGPSYDAGSSHLEAAILDVANGEGGWDAPSESGGDGSAASDGPNASDAVNVLDATEASSPLEASTTLMIVACNADADCNDAGAGARCINGACTQRGQLCSDTSQCVVSGEACVDGVCEPHCSAAVPCPAGYGCDFTRGVCSVNPRPCGAPGGSTCQGGSTCVEGRCVAPCARLDAGSACPTGQVCVNGGCIPNEAATFSCKNDGQSGALATVCGATDICLHHDCYPACDPEAGTSACANPAAICKSVTVAAGTYLVCAPAASLGSDCDPAAGKACPAGICIDGYCK